MEQFLELYNGYDIFKNSMNVKARVDLFENPDAAKQV